MTTIWSSTNRAPMSGSMRIPVDTSVSSSPGYIDGTAIANYLSGALGGGTGVAGLTAGSTGAAGANVTAIQAALDAGGTVFLATPGTYYINATLTIGSNTWLRGVPGVILRCGTGMNASALQNKNRASLGTDTRFLVTDIIFDGDKANQTTAFSTVDIKYATYFQFIGCEFNGGLRTGTFPTVSSDGEGIVLRNCAWGRVIGCTARDNAYDGFKTRDSDYCLLADLTAVDNGRAGVQICFDAGSTAALTPSTHIVINGLNVYHSTGTAHASSPNTSGIYFHGAQYCTASNINIYGTQSGIGSIEYGHSNVITNATMRTRYNGTHGVIDFQGDNNNYNVIDGFVIEPLSGASGALMRFQTDASYNRVSNGKISKGAGTGTWTITLTAAGCRFNQITNNLIKSGDYSTTDSGTSTTISQVDYT